MRHIWPLAVGFALLACNSGFVAQPRSGARPAQEPKTGPTSHPSRAAMAAAPKSDGLHLSGPYTHENLSVFLVHGPEALPNTTILTLDEALTAGAFSVYETGNVQELQVENTGADYVFVQAGDVVKGGRQDRVLSVDLLVPPGSRKLPIASFCVESGRWSGRQGEASHRFESAKKSVASKELKLAVKLGRGQGKVWEAVANESDKLSKKLDHDVRAARSRTSYQLAMENEDLEHNVERYVDALLSAPSRHSDVIGLAFAVSGEPSGADVYANRSLFQKQWPRMLRAAAVEALGSSKPAAPVEHSAIEALLRPPTAAPTVVDVAGEVEIDTVDEPKRVVQQTHAKKGRKWVHKSYVAK